MNEVGAQCGICTPGMILAALSLEGHRARRTLDDVKVALAGNLCRCTGYSAIYRAVMKWRGMNGDVATTTAT
jgi:aerobic-type carbon monoxide dehydrogenase small subunit (CoxS/CutS family)